MAGVRLTHRRSGSVVRVPQAKADSVSLADLGFRAEETKASKAPAKKVAAKKATAKKSSK